MPTAPETTEFAAWLGGMRPKLHRYCSRITGSSLDGEDALQDALVRAFEALERGTAVGNRDAWLFRVAHNAAQDLLRKRARQVMTFDEDETEDLVDPRSDIEERIAVDISLRTFVRLPAKQRACVILADVLGYGLVEVADILDTTVPATKAALHKGRLRLREIAIEPVSTSVALLDGEALGRARAYADLFQARDFDAIRVLLAEDVQLELVGRSKVHGRAAVTGYFGRYQRLQGWRAIPGMVDGQGAVLFTSTAPVGAISHFALIDWRAGEVSRIRDFRHADYVMEGAEIAALQGR